MKKLPRIYIALPVMAEQEALPGCIASICHQDYPDFHLTVCVNQPEAFHLMPEKADVIEQNRFCLEYLRDLRNPVPDIIDCSSPGRGWTGKKHGVGWARKTVMDHINTMAEEGDIILSMDADTVFPSSYLTAVAEAFERYPGAVALSAPYYHHLSGNAELDRSMLRYEIYMRYYILNLFRIENPYAFTALGSAMAVKAEAFRAVGGLTPKLSGEDFYFLQKLRKYGPLILNPGQTVNPGTRYSDRVFFGTGPALIKGKNNDWDSYPLYETGLFNRVAETYRAFPALYSAEQDTPMTAFLCEVFREDNIWEPLRLNAATLARFTRACCEKTDGLRILQYLKSSHNYQIKDEVCLAAFFQQQYPSSELCRYISDRGFCFVNAPLQMLSAIRDFLFQCEAEQRIKWKISPGAFI